MSGQRNDSRAIAYIDSRTASRTIDGEAHILSVRDSRLHQLNTVGTFIWELLEQEGRSAEVIVEEVQRAFAVDHARAERDTAEFLDELARLGLLRWGEPGDER